MQPGNSAPDTPSVEESRSYWNRWYIIVIVFLLIQVILYYFITAYFS
jgi:hypothetical protein